MIMTHNETGSVRGRAVSDTMAKASALSRSMARSTELVRQSTKLDKALTGVSGVGEIGNAANLGASLAAAIGEPTGLTGLREALEAQVANLDKFAAGLDTPGLKRLIGGLDTPGLKRLIGGLDTPGLKRLTKPTTPPRWLTNSSSLVRPDPTYATNKLIAEWVEETRAREEQRDAEHKAELDEERRERADERDARLRSERRERWMLRITIVSVAVAVLSMAAAVASVVWTLTHGSGG